jgi:hypothetical protein
MSDMAARGSCGNGGRPGKASSLRSMKSCSAGILPLLIQRMSLAGSTLTLAAKSERN